MWEPTLIVDSDDDADLQPKKESKQAKNNKNGEKGTVIFDELPPDVLQNLFSKIILEEAIENLPTNVINIKETRLFVILISTFIKLASKNDFSYLELPKDCTIELDKDTEIRKLVFLLVHYLDNMIERDFDFYKRILIDIPDITSEDLQKKPELYEAVIKKFGRPNRNLISPTGTTISSNADNIYHVLDKDYECVDKVIDTPTSGHAIKIQMGFNYTKIKTPQQAYYCSPIPLRTGLEKIASEVTIVNTNIPLSNEDYANGNYLSGFAYTLPDKKIFYKPYTESLLAEKIGTAFLQNRASQNCKASTYGAIRQLMHGYLPKISDYFPSNSKYNCNTRYPTPFNLLNTHKDYIDKTLDVFSSEHNGGPKAYRQVLPVLPDIESARIHDFEYATNEKMVLNESFTFFTKHSSDIFFTTREAEKFIWVRTILAVLLKYSRISKAFRSIFFTNFMENIWDILFAIIFEIPRCDDYDLHLHQCDEDATYLYHLVSSLVFDKRYVLRRDFDGHVDRISWTSLGRYNMGRCHRISAPPEQSTIYYAFKHERSINKQHINLLLPTSIKINLVMKFMFDPSVLTSMISLIPELNADVIVSNSLYLSNLKKVVVNSNNAIYINSKDVIKSTNDFINTNKDVIKKNKKLCLLVEEVKKNTSMVLKDHKNIHTHTKKILVDNAIKEETQRELSQFTSIAIFFDTILRSFDHPFHLYFPSFITESFDHSQPLDGPTKARILEHPIFQNDVDADAKIPELPRLNSAQHYLKFRHDCVVNFEDLFFYQNYLVDKKFFNKKLRWGYNLRSYISETKLDVLTAYVDEIIQTLLKSIKSDIMYLRRHIQLNYDLNLYTYDTPQQSDVLKISDNMRLYITNLSKTKISAASENITKMCFANIAGKIAILNNMSIFRLQFSFKDKDFKKKLRRLFPKVNNTIKSMPKNKASTKGATEKIRKQSLVDIKKKSDDSDEFMDCKESQEKQKEVVKPKNPAKRKPKRKTRDEEMVSEEPKKKKRKTKD